MCGQTSAHTFISTVAPFEHRSITRLCVCVCVCVCPCVCVRVCVNIQLEYHNMVSVLTEKDAVEMRGKLEKDDVSFYI
jgi:hypothetical protein